MGFTQEEQNAFFYTAKVTGFISMCSSSLIVYDISRRLDHKKRDTLKRIVLVMSITDICNSFAFFCSNWPMESMATCNLQGWVIQTGLAVPFLNCCLAITYLLRIRYNRLEQDLAVFEKYFYVISFLFPAVTATTALFLDQFNPAGMWCWISPYPTGCSEDDRCERGVNAVAYVFGFFYGPLWLLETIAAICMFLIVSFVRSTESAVQGKRYSGAMQSKSKFSVTKRVAKQGTYYVAAFFMTWIFGTVNRIQQSVSDSGGIFVLILLHSFFVPLQGALNAWVYFHPVYAARKEAGDSRFQAFKFTVFRSASLPANNASYDSSKTSSSNRRTLQKETLSRSQSESRQVDQREESRQIAQI